MVGSGEGGSIGRRWLGMLGSFRSVSGGPEWRALLMVWYEGRLRVMAESERRRGACAVARWVGVMPGVGVFERYGDGWSGCRRGGAWVRRGVWGQG